MSKCAELLQNKTEIDFIDVNVGCPIDLVFNKVTMNLTDALIKTPELKTGLLYH